MRLFLILAVTASVAAAPAWSQQVPRFKARILAFDGKNTLTVSSGTSGESLAVGLMPRTRLIYEEKTDALAIKPGDTVGATLARSGGEWQAQEAHLMPKLLHGQDEGLYPLPSDPKRRIVTGQVVANNLEAGQLTLSFRGSVGADGPTCTGRAPAQGGCKGQISFALPAKAPVVKLAPGDKSILVPGKIAAISVVAGPNGHLVTPGLTIEGDAPAIGGDAPGKSSP